MQIGSYSTHSDNLPPYQPRFAGDHYFVQPLTDEQIDRLEKAHEFFSQDYVSADEKIPLGDSPARYAAWNRLQRVREWGTNQTNPFLPTYVVSVPDPSDEAMARLAEEFGIQMLCVPHWPSWASDVLQQDLRRMLHLLNRPEYQGKVVVTNDQQYYGRLNEGTLEVGRIGGSIPGLGRSLQAADLGSYPNENQELLTWLYLALQTDNVFAVEPNRFERVNIPARA